MSNSNQQEGISSRIIKWNKKRNGLDYNPQLEAKMLSEEANEFYMADTFIDRVDAYCDFQFVAIGTQAKIKAERAYDSNTLLGSFNSDFNDFSEYIDSTEYQMLHILREDWERMGLYISLQQYLDKSLEIVLEANEAKGTTKGADGKVLKGEDYKKPEDSLEELLKDMVDNCLGG